MHYDGRSMINNNNNNKKARGVRCRRCCRKFISFFVSNVGLCVLVVVYSIAGAFMFRSIESPFEEQKALQVNLLRNETIFRLWNISKTILLKTKNEISKRINVSKAYHNNIDLHPNEWKQLMGVEIKKFQGEILKAIKDGYEGQHKAGDEQWSPSGSFLYSLTVISTIGYGNICPRTRTGKLVTIVYAIFGIPLMLLYLTNIGDILAKSFRYVYGGLCSCPGGESGSDRRSRQKRFLQQRSYSGATQASS